MQQLALAVLDYISLFCLRIKNLFEVKGKIGEHNFIPSQHARISSRSTLYRRIYYINS